MPELLDRHVYVFLDGAFRFYTVCYGSHMNDQRLIFRVRTDRMPNDRAAEKGFRNYDRIIPSTESEVATWFKNHPDMRVIRAGED